MASCPFCGSSSGAGPTMGTRAKDIAWPTIPDKGRLWNVCPEVLPVDSHPPGIPVGDAGGM